MSEELRFDGHVAVITGAGGGLGREYALYLAARGAAVVVNDLGSSRHGDGCGSAAADGVVRQIVETGGRAVANYDSVENGDRIVAAAIAHFGKIDILVNNAGFLRDKSFAKMSPDDWDMIQRVHLRAVFVTTQAAWRHFRQQRYGRVVMTSSAAGVFGNFGQANYSAAKCGVIGLARTLALEGERHNILTNVLVPAAASRLTADVVPAAVLQQLQPRLVAPAVALLCHSSCPANGAVLEAAGGAAALYRWQRGPSVPAPTGAALLGVWRQMEAALDGPGTSAPQSAAEQMALLSQELETMATHQSRPIAARAAANTITDTGSHSVSDSQRPSLPTVSYRYDSRAAILFALSVGVSVAERDGLRYLYEQHQHFAVHPMFACLLMNSVPAHALTDLPQLEVNLAQLLHGDHYLEIRKPLPVDGELLVKSSVLDVLDKGEKGAIIILRVEAFEASGDASEPLVVQQASLFVRGAGGFGGPASSIHSRPPAPLPQTPPDAVFTFDTSPDQAALYRLTGDLNPLHIDPEFAAAAAGQSGAIMHGLCVLSASVHRILGRRGPGLHRLVSVGARFSRPAPPGTRLLIDVWPAATADSPATADQLLFRTRSADSGQVLLSGGCITLSPVVPLTSDAWFARLRTPLSISLSAGALPSLGHTLQYTVTDTTAYPATAAVWVLEVRDSTVHVRRQLFPAVHADCVLTSDDVTATQLLSGSQPIDQAVSGGKLIVEGDNEGLHVLQLLIAPLSKL